MSTRVSVTNPVSGGASVEISITGNSFVIEDAPADAVADRNVIVFDDPETGVTGGIPLISRLKYLGKGRNSQFSRLFIKAINGSSANVTIVIFDSRDEDITLPDA